MKPYRHAILASAFALAILTVSGALPSVEIGWPLRLVTAASWLACLVAMLRSGQPQVAIGPLFILGSVALVFYSLVPAAYTDIFLGPPIPMAPDAGPYVIEAFDSRLTALPRLAMGSNGELLVLQFALLAFSLAPWSVPLSRTDAGVDPAAGFSPWAAVALVLAAAILYRLVQAGIIAGGLATDIRTAAPVVVTVVLGQCALVAWQGQRKAVVVLVAVIVVALLLMLPDANKPLSVAICLALILILSGKSLSRRLRWGLVALAVIVPLVAQANQAVHRRISLHYSDRLPSEIAVIWLKAKLGLRQAETVYCLEHILREADREQMNRHPGQLSWFAAGLVPRVFWPDKPSLSLGSQYAVDYCGFRHVVAESGHSASVTLLGEPLIHGGRVGLAVAATALALVLMGLSAIWVRRGTGALVVLGLEPWLVDFDQHLGLYVANCVKLALIATVVAVLLRMAGKARRHRESTSV